MINSNCSYRFSLKKKSTAVENTIHIFFFNQIFGLKNIVRVLSH